MQKEFFITGYVRLEKLAFKSNVQHFLAKFLNNRITELEAW